MDSRGTLKLEWYKKAETDSNYAIAISLLLLAEAVEDLGFGRGENKGCLEKLAMEVENVADSISMLASRGE